MKLILNLNNEEKIFTTPFVSGRQYRKLLEYDQRIDYMDMSIDDVDELVGYVRSVFGDQFTVDEFYDGIPSHEVMEAFLDVFSFVRSGEVKKVDDTGNEQGK